VLKGLSAVDYAARDIVYRPRNVRAHRVYGFSPVQQVLMTVTLNEMRDALGLDPYDNAAADRPMVLTATGYVPIEANAGGEGADTGNPGASGQSANSVKPSAKPALGKAAPDDPEHPGWPADTPGGRGGKFRPKDDDAGGEGENISSANVSDAARYAALDTGSLTDETTTVHDSTESRVARGSDWRLLPVNLVEEEEPNGFGHTIGKHVGKSPTELIEQLQEDNFRIGTVELVRIREGSFDSIESANDLVNRTLLLNEGEVDRVASGQIQGQYIQFDFGFTTGYEMWVPPSDTTPEMRKTTGVGIYISYDPGSPRGFRVMTAFPRNFD
jgi:hypothetical protein